MDQVNMSDQKNIISVNDLSLSYDGGKNYALKQVNFSLKQGRICAIVGNSGSGKTSLLRLIAGLERPNTGSIYIKGQEVSSPNSILAPQKRGVGMVFQNFTLFPHLTVAQNIAFGLKDKQSEKVASLLQMIELEGYENRYPNELSGGQQQRVALARTLAVDPQLLLLDEPFSSLDASLKSKLRLEIQSILKKINISMIFITHDIQDAIAIADDIIFLQAGHIIEQGALQACYKNAQSDYAKGVFQQLKENAQRILNLED